MSLRLSGMALGVEPKLVIFTSVDELTTGALSMRRIRRRRFFVRCSTPSPLASSTWPVQPDTPNRVLAAKPLKVKRTGDFPRPRSRLGWKIGILTDALRLNSAHPSPETATESTLHWQGPTPSGRTIWFMPSLKGLTPREALHSLQGHHFQFEMRGVGMIRLRSRMWARR